MKKAVAYLRSSKDRSDVSLSAQLHELQTLAEARKLTIVRTYEDAVVSGSSDVSYEELSRPAFSELVTDIRDPNRGWTHLLVYDTSRIARGRHIAQPFARECKRRGVELIIGRVPETDPISTVIIESVMQAMDEVHSLMSRDKGLAGMRENVRRGFRAGGRAPWGYQLSHEPTGAIRDGKPVMKSRLALSHESDTAQKYLKLRASGVPRVEAMRQANVTKAKTSLIGTEWNALVYAGHTVWNQNAPKKQRGAGNCKRRDRAEWVIKRDTHPALISEAEAEAVIAQIQTSNVAKMISAAKAARGSFLLSGLMHTEDGRPWIGAGDCYRLKPRNGHRGKFARRDVIERAVVSAVRADLQSDELVNALVQAAHDLNGKHQPCKAIDAEIAKLTRQRERAARLAVEYDGDAYARLVAELGKQIAALRRESEALAAEQRASETMQAITPAEVRSIIADIDNERALVSALVGRVILDPNLKEARIEYCLHVASPRRSDRWAVPVRVTKLTLPGALPNGYKIRAA